MTLARADWVVTVTERVAELYRSLVPESEREKVLLYRNGIDRVELAPAPKPDGPYRLLYLGTIYRNRDPAPLLRALAQLRDEGQLPARGVRLEFVGSVALRYKDALPALIKRLNLSDTVALLPSVPNADVPALMARSHMLLLLATDQPLQVPNKLYDYLGASTPILGVVDAAGETRELLERVGGHHIVTSNEIEPLRTALSRIFADADIPSVPVVPEELLESLASERVFRNLAAEITALMGSPLATLAPAPQLSDRAAP